MYHHIGVSPLTIPSRICCRMRSFHRWNETNAQLPPGFASAKSSCQMPSCPLGSQNQSQKTKSSPRIAAGSRWSTFGPAPTDRAQSVKWFEVKKIIRHQRESHPHRPRDWRWSVPMFFSFAGSVIGHWSIATVRKRSFALTLLR